MRKPEGERGLILWDPDFALDWLGRNDTYIRLRARANAGTPALTVQAYADVLKMLRFRRLSESQIVAVILEIKEQFALLDLTPDRAEAFALVAAECERLTEYETVRGEAWFAWQFALCRREGCHIMTKAPSRYAGLVPRDRLA